MIVLYFLILLLICVAVKICQKLTSARCKSPTCLIGKTALVTGGNSGIGYETALGLAARGCRVIIADIDNCNKSKRSIITKTGNNNIVTKNFDLASLNSIRQLARDINETEERLDILINNAGSAGLGNTYTADGLHIGMQVNHFGPFLLTHLLIDLLKRSAPSRVIFVSSLLAYLGGVTLTKNNLNLNHNYAATLLSEVLVYSRSKFCNVMTAYVLAKKLKNTGVTFYSLHPGVVYTPIYKKFCSSIEFWPTRILTRLIYVVLLTLSKHAEEGAQTSLYLALEECIQNKTGRFFIECIPFKMPPQVRSENINEIWRISEDCVKLLPKERI